MNRVTLMGRIGKDPEVRNLESGRSVANLTMATSERYKDKKTGEKKEDTTWHNLVAWGPTADLFAKYVHKGDMLLVEGKITNRMWEKDGTKHYATDIVVDRVEFVGSSKAPNRQEPAGSGATEPEYTVSGSGEAGDELPF